jgi:hypothetical protein
MHQAALDFVGRCVTHHGPWFEVIDVGGRDVNGSPRPLFWKSRYTVVDLEAGPGVDVVADARSWAPETPPDCVLCLEVLEHTPGWWGLLERLSGWLTPGGALIVTCAGPGRDPHSGHDGGPVRPGEWYENRTVDELITTTWWGDWSIVELSTPPGDVQVMWRMP